MKRSLALLTLLAALGCDRTTDLGIVPQPPDAALPPDAGVSDGGSDCPVPCGAVCCSDKQLCVDGRCEPKPCEKQCDGRQCGPDGCGGQCGTCGQGERCDVTRGICECAAETDKEFCERLEKTCGSVTAPDNCGTGRTRNCGICSSKEFCNEQHVCEPLCVPESDLELCGTELVQCGPWAGTDRCGNDRTVLDCGQCPAGDECNGSTRQCQLCVNETPEEFCSRLHKNCSGWSGNDNCGAPRTVANCGTCADGEVCGYDSVCGAPRPPANDVCPGAIAISLDAAGDATVYGNTELAKDDTSSFGCSGEGRDVVFSLTLASERDVEITLRSTWDALIVSLRSDCDDPQTELKCAKNTQGYPAAFTFKRLAPGTYYLWVDGSAKGGAFALDVRTFTPKAPPPNDWCPSATALSFNGDVAVIDGDTTKATDDYRGSCSIGSGLDVVYAVTLSQDSALTARVTRDPSISGLQPAVYIVDDCSFVGTGNEKACGGYVAGSAVAMAPRLPAGTYYIVVDGQSATYGPFRLEVTRAPAFPFLAHDVCSGAKPLQFNGQVAIETGDTRGAEHDYNGTCDWAAIPGGRDLVYSFELSDPAAVTVRVMRDNSTPLYQPAVYVRSDCPTGDAASELLCAKYSVSNPIALVTSGNLSGAVLPAGVWYVIVDGTNGTSGKFTLEVTARPAPTNDNCPNAEPLTFDANGVASTFSNTAGASAHTSGTCSSTSKDLVFSFTLDEAASVDVLVTPLAGSTLRPTVYVRGQCEEKASELPKGCAAASIDGNPASLRLPNVPTGTWYVWVAGSNPGPFTLQVTRSAPVPALNDTCAGAQPLVFDATGRASLIDETSFGKNDYSGSCATGTLLMNGPDLIYSFEVTTPSSFVATLTRDSSTKSFRGALYLRKDCTSTAASDELKCAYAPTAPQYPDPSPDESHLTRIASSYLATGTYYLIVDSVGSSSVPGAIGKFSLDVKLTPAFPGDTCQNPLPLILDSNGIATVHGDTNLALNDFTTGGSCYGFKSNDLVYSLELPRERTVQLALTPDPAAPFNPTLSIRSSCEVQSTELAGGCDYNSSGAGPRSLFLGRVPAGTYYVWVDGYGPSNAYAGAFELTATVTTPPDAPLNDTCARPERLVLDAQNRAHATGDTTYAHNDYSGSCGGLAGFSGRDVVFSLDVPTDAAVTATVTRDSTVSPSYRPAVYIRSAICDDASAAKEKLCVAASSPYNTASASAALSAGTYYIVVDGQNGTSGAFSLDIVSQPRIANDTCSGAERLAFDGNGVATATGDLTEAVIDTTGSCVNSSFDLTNSYVGRDLVYQFNITQPKKVVVSLVGSASLKPAVYVRSDCEDKFSELVCSTNSTAGATATTTLNHLRPGTYWVWVEGYSKTVGTLTLTVTTTDVPALQNNTCSGATPLIFDGQDKATASGDTTRAANFTAGSCDASSYQGNNGELVFPFSVPQDSSVAVKLTRGTPTNADFNLFVRTDCELAGIDRESACIKGGGSSPVNLFLSLAQVGVTYYLFVDTANGKPGSFTLDLALGPPTLNDTCAHAEPLDVSRGAATTTGDTRYATNASNQEKAPLANGSTCSTSCGNYGGDLVYSFTLSADAAVTATVTPTVIPGTTSTPLYPVVAIRSPCEARENWKIGNYQNGGDLGASYASKAGQPATLSMPMLPAGTYYVWVDTYASSSTGAATAAGPFRLDLTVTAPQKPTSTNDLCANAELLQFDPATNTATATGDTRYAHDDASGTCAVTHGGDLAYVFRLSQPQMVTATVTRTAGNDAYTPAFYLRRDCASDEATDEVVCSKAKAGTGTGTGVANWLVSNLPGGTYWLIVDGERYSGGAFSLQVKLDPPSPTASTNDSCPDAQPLVFNGLTATAAGSTTSARHDTAGSCSSTALSPDVVYKFSLSQPQKVTLDVAPTAGSTSFQPVIVLRRDCGSLLPSDEVACKAGSAGAAASATVNNLAAGTYFVWVDGGGSATVPTMGDFTLTVTLDAPVPAPPNDTCAGAIELTRNTTIEGTTLGATQTYGWRPLPARCSGYALWGPDVVYSYSPATDGDFTVTVQPASNYDPRIWITAGQCAVEEACLAYSHRGGNGVPEYFTVYGLAGETYYVVVDSWNMGTGWSGNFTISVE